MVCRVCPSRHLPCRSRFAVGALAILQHDAHGSELVADAVGFLEVFSRTCSGTVSNQALDTRGIDTTRLLLARLPVRGALRQEAEHAQRRGECRARAFVG